MSISTTMHDARAAALPPPALRPGNPQRPAAAVTLLCVVWSVPNYPAPQRFPSSAPAGHFQVRWR